LAGDATSVLESTAKDLAEIRRRLDAIERLLREVE